MMDDSIREAKTKIKPFSSTFSGCYMDVLSLGELKVS